jgi:5-methyltetrahydrofolate--homocysteine methyltransferase
VRPQFIGTKNFDEYPLEEIATYIDWGFFFYSWEMPGKFPDILDDEKYGEEAQKLYDDAQAMLQKLIDDDRLKANGVIGFWPANSTENDNIEIYEDEERSEIKEILPTLRQQKQKKETPHYFSLCDYIAPKDSGITDYIGAMAVSAGHGLQEIVDEYEQKNDDYNSILIKVLADRLAEAFAECLHERMRKEFWGYAPDEELDLEGLLHIQYQGIRPAPGYPPCPDHTEKQIMWKLLDPDRLGISLTESCMMMPSASVSAFCYMHPDSKYFSVGRVMKDQVEEYAERKGMEVRDAERWLQSVLAYER